MTNVAIAPTHTQMLGWTLVEVKQIGQVVFLGRSRFHKTDPAVLLPCQRSHTGSLPHGYTFC